MLNLSATFKYYICTDEVTLRYSSFFVGSPESGVRFARLQSVFANIRNHKLNAVTYLCDVFRRIGKTAKEELVNLLPHKWQPMTV